MADTELTLIMKARNLASGAIDGVSGSLGTVTEKAKESHGWFAKLRGGLSLLRDGFLFALGPASLLIGALLKATGADKVLAAEIQKVVEKLAVALAPTIAIVVAWFGRVIAKVQDWIAHNQPLINQITTFVSGALSSFITALSRVVDFLGRVVHAVASNQPVMNFLRAVIGQIAVAFQTMTSAIQGTINKVATLIGWIKDLIGFIDRAIKALNSLNLIKDRTTIGGSNVPFPRHAEGGWAGLHGPELALLGERGPEYVTPTHQLGGATAPGYVAVAISKRDIARMVDEQLYFTLRRAAPTGGRI